MGDSAATIERCETCGYDLSGLPEDAVCPECGAPRAPLPIDAIANQPVETVARVTSGLALLAMTPLLVALSAVAMAIGVAVLLALPARTGQFDFGALVVGGALVVVVGTALVWLTGWIGAAAAPVEAAVSGATGIRQLVRATGVVGRLSIGAAVGLEIAGVWSRTLGQVAEAPEYLALVALGGTTVVGLWLIADLARRLRLNRTRDRAERGRFAACVVAGAVIIYMATKSIVIFPGGMLGMANLALSLLALIGSVWLFGAVADYASTLRRKCAEIYEAKSGHAHWSSHQRFRLLWMRVGDILRRQAPER